MAFGRNRGNFIRRIAVATTITIMASLSIVGIAQADSTDTGSYDCKTVDLAALFINGYSGVSWLGTSTTQRTVTWTVNAATINSKNVIRSVSEEEIQMLQAAFDSWDLALATIDFKQVPGQNADISIGWVGPLDQKAQAAGSQMSFSTYETWHPSTKQLVQMSVWLYGASTPSTAIFQHLALPLVGFAIGLDNVPESSDYRSVMEGANVQNLVSISKFDRQLARQIYGEELCNLTDRQEDRISILSAKADLLTTQLASLQNELSAAQQSVISYLASLRSAQSKLTKICKARPKPKGC